MGGEILPHCASSQTTTPRNKKKIATGAYPRLASRTIHLPVELDRCLSEMTAAAQKEHNLSDETAVSQLVRDVLIKVHNELKESQLVDQP